MLNNATERTVNLYIKGKKGFNSLKALTKNCSELINKLYHQEIKTF